MEWVGKLLELHNDTSIHQTLHCNREGNVLDGIFLHICVGHNVKACYRATHINVQNPSIIRDSSTHFKSNDTDLLYNIADYICAGHNPFSCYTDDHMSTLKTANLHTCKDIQCSTLT
jgi:hypothetical protein